MTDAKEQRAPLGERLWSPWRGGYVTRGIREEGCLFCNRLGATDDVSSLILFRGNHAFVIMNLYPYNTGHVMLAPNAHVASPEDADHATTKELAELRVPALRALRRALRPDGFNLGLNIGSPAGAGVADHFHEHVVPRWVGDANFMPILAGTMVMPELIPATYAKLRAEFDRELNEGSDARLVVIEKDTGVERASEPVRLEAEDDEPLWRTALREAGNLGVRDALIVGWQELPALGPKAGGFLVTSGSIAD